MADNAKILLKIFHTLYESRFVTGFSCFIWKFFCNITFIQSLLCPRCRMPFDWMWSGISTTQVCCLYKAPRSLDRGVNRFVKVPYHFPIVIIIIFYACVLDVLICCLHSWLILPVTMKKTNGTTIPRVNVVSDVQYIFRIRFNPSILKQLTKSKCRWLPNEHLVLYPCKKTSI